MNWYAWFLTLLIALGGSPHASAQDAAPAASPEPLGFSRIIVSPEGPVTLQGTASPGDRIVLRVNGRQTAEARADARGQWRLRLAGPLQPGDHTLTAIAAAPGSAPAEASEDVRIAIPEAAAIPNYTDREHEPGPSVDHGPPNAATRRLAAELARDASREFSKLTADSDESDETQTDGRQARAAGEAADDSGATTSDLRSPGHWFAAITAWLARARHDYNEVLVAGLSDPARRGNDVRSGETPVDGPPLPDRAGDTDSRIASLVTRALGWLQRANRDYHEYVVRELALRGIEDPHERQIARSAASAPDEITTPADNDDVKAEPSPPELGRDAEDQRIAETRRAELAEARSREAERTAEERRLADERAAEELERQREAAEAEAREHQLAEAQRREQEQARERQQSEQRTEEARIVQALESHLTERARWSRSAEGETSTPKPPAAAGSPSVQREAALPETAELGPPPLPSRAREKLRNPPLPIRAQVMPPHPPLPELFRARAAVTARREAPPSATTAKRVQTIARAKRKPASSHDRRRGCKNPAAGRRIDPPGTYIVAYGDTLWDIAERHYNAGHLYRRIQRANRRKIARTTRIYPCQRIWLPPMKRRRR